jgi:hypothetical protein
MPVHGRECPITNQFSATQIRILRVLADGLKHSAKELLGALEDDQASTHTVHQHIYLLRQKLVMIGHEIVTDTRRRTSFYRHIVVQKPGLIPDSMLVESV